MKTKILMSLLFALAALPAAAQDFGSIFGQALPLVAQMSQEERRAMRERWERVAPEERSQLRRTYQENMRRMPPEQFDPRNSGMGEQMQERWQERGFGTGYERRHHEEDQYESDRNGNERRGRGRR